MRSAIYTGSVHHNRSTPVKHAFTYTLFMFFVDVDELDDVIALSSFISKKGWAPLQFKRNDFHKNQSECIKESVYNTVQRELDFRPSGPVAVLSNWRCFGFNFNPLTTYYCFDERGESVEAIVAEVTNTPWLERHPYVIDVRGHSSSSIDEKGGDTITAQLEKKFTVSPFNPVNMTYYWHSTIPSEQLMIGIDTHLEGQKVFSACMSLSRIALTKKNVRRTVMHFPFMTFRVVWRIYWQALKLYIKGVPFLGKDKNISSF